MFSAENQILIKWTCYRFKFVLLPLLSLHLQHFLLTRYLPSLFTALFLYNITFFVSATLRPQFLPKAIFRIILEHPKQKKLPTGTMPGDFNKRMMKKPAKNHSQNKWAITVWQVGENVTIKRKKTVLVCRYPYKTYKQIIFT